MNKKLLFGIMSLAALASCSTDDFESQKVAEKASSVQFEVINNDALTRASMNGNKVEFSAKDGDLFTLYHGGTIALDGDPLTAFQNATYKASTGEGGAVLTTPSMINQGYAIMTWPADTTFRASAAGLTIVIPQDQTDEIQYQLPYVSDIIDIQAYAAYTETAPATAYNTAGKDRKYSVYMRPMASQLNLKAEYNGTDATIAALEAGEDGIDPIKVTSIELLTTPGGGTTDFTTEIPLKFTAAATYAPAVEALPATGIAAMWNAADANNAWSHVTCFDVANIVPAGQTDKLTTTYLDGNAGAKFLILPQANITTGLADPGIVVNTIYGKVVIADPAGTNVHGTKYSAAEYADAWYRYLSTAKAAADAEENASITPAVSSEDPNINGKFKTVAINPAMGLQQTINYMSTYEAKASLPAIQSEPLGVALTRYVNVNLGHLDMSELHIKSDKQLRDAAKVWKTMDLDDVTVYLDGDATNGEFEISQTTIDKINEINASIPGGTKSFKVKPCTTAGEVCTTIVITGGGNIKDLTFIKDNAGTQAAVAFKAGENWKWAASNTVTVANTACGISKFINRGTFTSDATATINVKDDVTPTPNWVNKPFENAEGATWNISGATLNVQFNVTNYGTVNIAKGAQYRQDGQEGATVFKNEATALPTRFGGNDAEIGKVENKGVFATVAAGTIDNYGLIEHADNDAKTYITNNQLGGAFGTAFGATNKMGRINLPFSNKDEDNVSVSAALAQGFVSVTVDGEVSGALDASVVGSKVNYVIVNSGITEIQAVSAQVMYLEINQPGTELAWNVPTTTNYRGLMVLSDVNVKLGTTLNVLVATYLGADMYVGGTFTTSSWSGYFGNTTTDVASKYITY